ncbi:MAG TPA: hypothetical protein VHY08_19870 [Bacillota bacterium]|nr:hypothetical protein [Bacillota bacterium]
MKVKTGMLYMLLMFLWLGCAQRTWAATIFSDGFESSLGNWTALSGTPSTISTYSHSGTKSYVINEGYDSIQHTMSGSCNKVAVVWFYDDANDLSMRVMAFVDNYSTNKIGLGVDTAISTDKYVYQDGDGGSSTYHQTNINRTYGWHQLVWDYRSGYDVKLYIDQTIVYSATTLTSFSKITIGDQWNDGIAGTVYFDDVEVRDELPTGIEEFSGDSFEDGFNYWCTTKGTPTTSNTVANTGSNSYVMNEEQDCIAHYFPASQHKVIDVWFYDNADDTSLEVLGMIYEDLSCATIGVLTTLSTTNYMYSVSNRLPPPNRLILPLSPGLPAGTVFGGTSPLGLMLFYTLTLFKSPLQVE